jgi:hypothetical protein
MQDGTDQQGRTAPTGLLVYESMFGNTAQVAQAVAMGLREGGIELEVVNVRDHPTPEKAAEQCDLLVVGGPTHGFSLSRPSTRHDAVRQGAPVSAEDHGLREWIDALPERDENRLAATFDTRVTKVRRLPKAAANRAGRLLHTHGYDVITKPSGFLVEDASGPLVRDELKRAQAWGRDVATTATRRLAASARP